MLCSMPLHSKTRVCRLSPCTTAKALLCGRCHVWAANAKTARRPGRPGMQTSSAAPTAVICPEQRWLKNTGPAAAVSRHAVTEQGRQRVMGAVPLRFNKPLRKEGSTACMCS